MKRLTAAALAALLLLSACSSTDLSAQSDKSASVTLTVSAAASLHDVLKVLTRQYEQENKSVHININSASSGTLAKQIEEGAPADLYISASQKYMDELEKKALIDENSREILLSNQLVLIQPKQGDIEQISSINGLTNHAIQHIAIGEPSIVPAGQYAKEALINEKLWNDLKDKYVPTKDVTQALSYVETGNAEAGFVYKSDAVTSDKVKISLTVPESDHQHILYPESIIKSSNHKKTAKDFISFLNSDQAQKVFKHYGFTPVIKGD